MIRSSRAVIEELLEYGVDFAKKDGELDYTREACHSKARILFHEDVTGEEITSKLLQAAKKRSNVRILDHVTMLDIIESENICLGILAETKEGGLLGIEAGQTILASGGIGGLYQHSTNYPHLYRRCSCHSHASWGRIGAYRLYPDTPYYLVPHSAGKKISHIRICPGRGAKLYNAKGERFANEVLPRDLMTEAIYRQMEEE